METKSVAPTHGTDPLREKVKEIFVAVCDLPPSAQRIRLEELCGSNQELLQQVEHLLKNDLQESLFETEIPPPKDSWIGKTIQNYKILERLGEGGMGVVYRGEDLRLRRPVAIKFLGDRLVNDASLRERFLREAQAAASLDHPSICTVFDIGEAEGQPYIVTAYLAGETLEAAIRRRKPSFSAILDYAIQLAEGLQAAHAKGIVHRDLKPSNVILTVNGGEEARATIIDFGLAQVSWGNRLTQAGRLIGTANYICPQLLRGEPIAEQSDIWSLGVMLYEMLASHAPFNAENREHLFYLICHENPPALTSIRPDLPPEIGRIVSKALEKDIDRRYPAMSDLLRDLRALQRQLSSSDASPASGFTTTLPITPPDPTPNPAEPALAESNRSLRDTRLLAVIGAVLCTTASWLAWSRLSTPPATATAFKRVAVMPFEDLSAGERNERLSRTLGESLAVRLAGLSNVQMVSTSPVRNNLQARPTDHEVSSQLHLDYLVTGFVERSGSTLRVTANLISGKEYAILSSNKIDLPWSDMATMQNRFADSVAREIGVKLAPRTTGSAMPATRADAYDLLMKARYSLFEYVNRQQPEFLETAEKRLRRAIELDPHYADALAEMADLLMWKLYPPRGNRPELLNEAGIWLDRALAEDPKHPRANRLMSNLQLERGKSSLALEYARRAVHQSPEDADALHQLDKCYGALGFYESALVENEKSIAGDVPLMFPLYWNGWYLIELGRFNEARESITKLLVFDRQGIGASANEAFLELHRGNYQRAKALYQKTQQPGFAYEAHSEIGAALASVSATGNVAAGNAILQKYGSAGPRLTDVILLLAAASGQADTMARLTRESSLFANYGWLVRNARFFKKVAGQKPFRDLVFDLHRTWETNLAELGPTLPVRPPQLPKPDAFLASLR